ncbi:MAG: hypothetical protein HY520_04750 [Candidatus Aenigmarchaeota archaeon]|nr:hypothetical protein [Candidatus Aenigmarchaeota archaeon]
MRKTAVPRKWLEKAEHDIDTAEFNLKGGRYSATSAHYVQRDYVVLCGKQVSG